MSKRTVTRIVDAQPASDGDGVKLKRVMGRLSHELMDPFLMLDELRSDEGDELGGGFPSHPHRGIETVSIMLKGGFRHEDHMGNQREVSSGGMQWMNAGRGVIHSEMPIVDDQQMHGFQLWLNLPQKNKMSEPGYWDVEAGDIPEVVLSGGTGRLLAGTLEVAGEQFKGAMERDITEPLIVDLHLLENSKQRLKISSEKALFYVYRGSVQVEEQVVNEGQLALLSEGDELVLNTKQDCGLLLLGGKPLKEPVAQYGPFVMNTQEEIMQAMTDYRNDVLTD